MAFGLSRSLGGIPLDVVVREQLNSSLTITENPVEVGAAVTDHAYINPKRITMEAISGSRAGMVGASAAYAALVRLQETREPFDIVAGFSLFRNMLIEDITVDRLKGRGRICYFTAELVEVILVDTASAGAGGGGLGGLGGFGGALGGIVGGVLGGVASSVFGRGMLQSGLTASRLASSVVDRGAPTLFLGNTATQAVTNVGLSAFRGAI